MIRSELVVGTRYAVSWKGRGASCSALYCEALLLHVVDVGYSNVCVFRCDDERIACIPASCVKFPCRASGSRKLKLWS